MSESSGIRSLVGSAFSWLLPRLGWIYFLRVPILTGFGFLLICVLAFFTGVRSHLGGAFDIESYLGIFWVSLIAFLFAWVVAVAWRRVRSSELVRCFGNERSDPSPERSDSSPEPSDPSPEGLRRLGYRLLNAVKAVIAPPIAEGLSRFAYGLLIAVIALPIVGFALWGTVGPAFADGCQNPFMYECSPLSVGGAVISAMLGFFVYGVCIIVVGALGKRGYGVPPGGITARPLLVLTSIVYVGIGIIDYLRIRNGMPTIVPTLGYALLLFTLLCWGFSSLTILLDRYRIPVLLPLVVVLCITSFLPGLKSDFYYPVTPEPQEAQVPASGLPKDDLPQKKIIVVAATGGGIQSATWTARVLTGLEEECRKEKCDQGFDKSIRLISAVSGGSVGTIHFVNEYKGGHLPSNDTDSLALKKIVRRAQSSSLDYAVWGLLYPDFVRLFIPLPVRLSWDRGRALEQAWISQQETLNTGEGLEDTLSEWRNDARAGVRPAVILNATVTETGQRLPLTTSEPIEGRLDHEDLLARDEPNTDISIATAARLSAAWPYVSPAARADVDGVAPHLVDGGYYDNYGIASLVEWLDEELEREKREGNPDIEKVLVVEVNAAGTPCPTEEPTTGEEGKSEETTSEADKQSRDENINDRIKRKRGWFYQAFAPPSTALKVRGSAQHANNEVALNLLIDKWDKKEENEDEDVDITEANFTFDGSHPPTSWHLTDKQKGDIERAWQAEINKECNNDQGWDKVADFLGAKAGPGEPSKVDEDAQRPKDWPASPVNIAHRGGRYLAPENTLIGFQEGLLRAGVDVLEFDVHLTEDGHLVVIHDDKVDRTTDGTGLVREMTLREIKSLDAAYDFPDEDSKTHPYRDQGITVPTLEEVYQQFPETPVNIEIKEAQPGIEEALWEEIEEAGATDRTLVVSQKRSVIQRFREVSGGRVATGASVEEIGGFIFWSHLYPSLLLRSPYQALQVPKEIVTPGFVQAAHRSHRRVDAWTVNKEQDMRRSLDREVDGIMTDRPDVLNRVLERESKDGG